MKFGYKFNLSIAISGDTSSISNIIRYRFLQTVIERTRTHKDHLAWHMIAYMLLGFYGVYIYINNVGTKQT